MRPVVSALEMAELDRRTITDIGIPGRVLMEVAGRHVADACSRFVGPRGIATPSFVVACGPGNNGGDGFVVARVLAQRGYHVRTFVFAERARIGGDALSCLLALERSTQAPVVFVDDARRLADFSNALVGVTAVVDALLGVGVRGAVRGMLADAITTLNDARVPVLAVDVPSGVDADTGAVLGSAVVASATVTFAFAKRGHYLHPGAGLCGEVSVVDIGVPRALAEQLGVVGSVLLPGDIPTLVPKRRMDAHKGSFGTLTVVAGSENMPGAAQLALAGALRGGAGLVRLAGATSLVAHSAPSEVVRLSRGSASVDAFAEQILAKSSAVVVGPGWGSEDAADKVALLKILLKQPSVPVCVDADGLNLLAAHPELWRERHAPMVITPHPREMARLTGLDVEAVLRDKFASAMQLAMSRGCVVVLKGAGTVVAEPSGATAIVAAGNPGMATAGTGDVLAGLVGALLAQGLEVGTAASAGALVHAVAGDYAAARMGQAGLVAHDVAEEIAQVWRHYGR